MRKITFAVYGPPKEGLPYLAEGEAYSLKAAMVAIETLQ
jgi:hypothetical protein